MPGITPPPEKLVDGERYYHLPGPSLDEVSIRRIVAAFQAAFDEWPSGFPSVSAEEHLSWKLSKPGELRPQVSLIEDVDGAILVTNLVLPRAYLLCGEPIWVADWCDATVAPHMQGRGYYAKGLMHVRAVDSYFKLTMNFARNPRVLSNRRSRSETAAPANSIRTLVRPIIASDFARLRDHNAGPLRAAFMTAGISAASGWGRLLNRWRLPAPAPVAIEEVTEFDDSVDEVFASAAEEFDFIEVRDANYLNWRFCDPRGGSFTTLAVTERDRLVGYAAFASAPGRFVLADLLAGRGRLDVVRSVVNEVLVRAEAEGASEVYCWLPRHHPYRRTLLGYGFVDVGARSGVNMRMISTSEEQAQAIYGDRRLRMHLMQGDTDAV